VNPSPVGATDQFAEQKGSLTFKSTEIGVLPTDWHVIRMSERATFRTGPFGSALHKSDYTDGGVPVINPVHIIDGKLVPADSTTITEKAAQLLDEFRLHQGDVIIGRRGDMGRCAVVQPIHAGWLCGTGSMIIRCKAGLLPGFAQLVLSSPRAVSAITDTSVGSTMANLNQAVLAHLRIQLPSEHEQRAISAALSDVDTLIDALDKLISKKRAIRWATAQRLLTGRMRLPRFDPKKVGRTQTDIGLLPQDWEVRKLGDIGQCFIGLTFDPSNVSQDGTVVLRASNIGESGLRFDDMLRVDMVIPEKLLLTGGDLLICVRNGSRPLIGKCSLIDSLPEPMTFGAFMSVFRSTWNRFVFYCFQSDLMKRQIHEHLGATINQITNKSLTSFRIPFPSAVEQDAIVRTLGDMDAEIVALENRREKLRAIKLGMMQVLLTGRVRLVKAEAVA
jgi:type I restriction enzyme, S subunit